MTDTAETLTRLNEAIRRVTPPVLVSLLMAICETNPSARALVKDRLFVDEAAVPQPGTPPKIPSDFQDSDDSDASDDKAKEDAKPPSATTGPKRLRTRYAWCKNCEEEYDISANTATSCSYHPDDYPEPDEDMFVDHDVDCHGPIDTEDNRSMYPESFIYSCCDRHGDEEPCVTDWHRERQYKGSKRQKY